MGLFSRGKPDDAEPPPLPYEPMSMPGLAARWLRWAAAGGPMHNPVDDPDGADALRNQPDDVVFVAGSVGRTVTRRFSIPAGRPLFLPVINMWAAAPEKAELSPDASGGVLLDGVPQASELVETPVPFEVRGAALNVVTSTRKPVEMTVVGLWALLPPPTPGEHVLRVRATDGHAFELDVTAHITAG